MQNTEPIQRLVSSSPTKVGQRVPPVPPSKPPRLSGIFPIRSQAGSTALRGSATFQSRVVARAGAQITTSECRATPCRRFATAVQRVSVMKTGGTAVVHGRRLQIAGTGGLKARHSIAWGGSERRERSPRLAPRRVVEGCRPGPRRRSGVRHGFALTALRVFREPWTWGFTPGCRIAGFQPFRKRVAAPLRQPLAPIPLPSAEERRGRSHSAFASSA